MEQPKQQPASLKDVLPQGYSQEDYFTDSELRWIRSTFANPANVKIIRKIFLPTFHDAELPIEELKSDPWMANVDFTQMPAEHVKAIVAGRQEALKFVMGALVRLKVIATMKQETEVEEKARLAQNSNR